MVPRLTYGQRFSRLAVGVVLYFARGIILTRYAIRSFEFCEKFLYIAPFAPFSLLQTLPDSF
jgi:hypothetical protein